MNPRTQGLIPLGNDRDPKSVKQRARNMYMQRFSGIAEFVIVTIELPKRDRSFGPNLSRPITIDRKMVENLRRPWVAFYVHWTGWNCNQLEVCGFIEDWKLSSAMNEEPKVKKEPQQTEEDDAGDSKYPKQQQQQQKQQKQNDPNELVLWRNQFAATPPEWTYDGPSTSSKLFNAYSEQTGELPHETTLSIIETMLRTRVAMFSFIKKLKRKHDIRTAQRTKPFIPNWWNCPMSEIPSELQSSLLLLNDEAVQADEMSFLFMVGIIRNRSINFDTIQKSADSVQLWRQMETDLLRFRMNTSHADCAPVIFKQLPRIEQHLERYPKDEPVLVILSDLHRNPDNEKLIRKLTTFDKSLTAWVMIPFSLCVWAVGKRAVVVHNGFAYVPFVMFPRLVVDNFQQTLDDILMLPISEIGHDKRVIRFFSMWLNMFGLLAGEDRDRADGKSAHKPIMQYMGEQSPSVPRCMQEMYNRSDWRFPARYAFQVFALQLDARPEHVVAHWRPRFSKRHGHTADAELRGMLNSLIKDRKKFKRNGYRATCQRLMKDGLCWHLHHVSPRMHGDEPREITAMRNCRFSLNKGTSSRDTTLPPMGPSSVQPSDMFLFVLSMNTPMITAPAPAPTTTAAASTGHTNRSNNSAPSPMVLT